MKLNNKFVHCHPNRCHCNRKNFALSIFLVGQMLIGSPASSAQTKAVFDTRTLINKCLRKTAKDTSDAIAGYTSICFFKRHKAEIEDRSEVAAESTKYDARVLLLKDAFELIVTSRQGLTFADFEDRRCPVMPVHNSQQLKLTCEPWSGIWDVVP